VITREYLESLLIPQDDTQKWVKKTIEGRGDYYYGYLKHKYKREVLCFWNMQYRVKRKNLETDFAINKI